MVMIFRIVQRSFLAISTVNAFLTRRTGLVSFRAVGCIKRPFLSTSDGSNLQLEVEIKELKDEIVKLERELLTVVDSRERAAIRNQMDAIRNQMDAIRNQVDAIRNQVYGTRGLLRVLNTKKSQQDNAVMQGCPPSPRKARWDALNKCLEAAREKAEDRSNDEVTTSLSSVKYEEVKSVFDPIMQSYIQDIKALPAEKLESLSQFLAMTDTCISDIVVGDETQRLYFIFPILVVVCSLFDGEVKIIVEKDLDGKNAKANGRFEFILQRGNKRVCIVQAKKDDMEQGRAHCLIGCEVASDLYNLRTVYGIVTTFELWTFYRSCDDKIERNSLNLGVEGGVVNTASLMKIAGKIYAMLSDDDS